jgi:hypothetical protein
MRQYQNQLQDTSYSSARTQVGMTASIVRLNGLPFGASSCAVTGSPLTSLSTRCTNHGHCCTQYNFVNKLVSPQRATT